MSKLRNGHVDTGTMIRLLSRHEDWTATVPETDNHYALRARFIYRGGPVVEIVYPRKAHPRLQVGDLVVLRSDWTIHKPRKKKP